VIASTAPQLEKLFATVGPERAGEAPAPGKWSAREILCHLADCETVFAFRLRQGLAEPHHVIQPFDQDAWSHAYAIYDANAALAVFSAMRNWNLAFIRALKPEDLAKALTHPERGEQTLGEIVETMAGHDINHLRQVEAIAGRSRAA
jgi:uncharacterized damage-inducible protein DinB